MYVLKNGIQSRTQFDFIQQIKKMSDPFVLVEGVQWISFDNFQVNFHTDYKNPPIIQEETSNTGHEKAATIQDLQKKDKIHVKKKSKSKDNHRRIAQRILKLLKTNKTFLKQKSVYKYFLNEQEIANIKKNKMKKEKCREEYGQRIDPNTVSRHQIMTNLYSISELRKYIGCMFKNGKMKRQIQLAERAKKTVDANQQSNSTTKTQICCNYLQYVKEFVTVFHYNQIDGDGQNSEEQNRDEGNQYLSVNSMVASLLNEQTNQQQSKQIFQKLRESQRSQELLLPASLKGAIQKKERDSN